MLAPVDPVDRETGRPVGNAADGLTIQVEAQSMAGGDLRLYGDLDVQQALQVPERLFRLRPLDSDAVVCLSRFLFAGIPGSPRLTGLREPRRRQAVQIHPLRTGVRSVRVIHDAVLVHPPVGFGRDRQTGET
jgi:hypothetical protein